MYFLNSKIYRARPMAQLLSLVHSASVAWILQVWILGEDQHQSSVMLWQQPTYKKQRNIGKYVSSGLTFFKQKKKGKIGNRCQLRANLPHQKTKKAYIEDSTSYHMDMLGARHHAKSFTCMSSFKPHTCGQVLVSPFDTGGSCCPWSCASLAPGHRASQGFLSLEGKPLEPVAGAATKWAPLCTHPGYRGQLLGSSATGGWCGSEQ